MSYDEYDPYSDEEQDSDYDGIPDSEDTDSEDEQLSNIAAGGVPTQAPVQPAPQPQTVPSAPVAQQGRSLLDFLPSEAPSPGTATPIRNPNGSVTTERSITINDERLNGGRATNIPTVWGGQVVPDSDAVENAVKSGRSFPSYDDVPTATSAAQQRSNDLGTGAVTSVGGASGVSNSPKSLMDFLPASNSPTTGPWTQMLKDQEAKGLWGDQYGAPIGQGHVEVGGTVVSGTSPKISQSTRQSPTTATQKPPVQTTTGLPTTLDVSSRQANITQWAPALARVEQETGLSAAAVGGIIIAENGGGQSDIAKNANNYFSIHYAGLPGQTGNYKGTGAAIYESAQSNLDAFVRLVSTEPRYAAAWENRADPEKFWGELINAGYIEPGDEGRANWLKNLRSGKDQYEEIAAKAPAPKAVPQTQSMPTRGVTPSQAEIAKTDADGWSLCGPVAVMGAANWAGKSLTVAQAKALGEKNGWTGADGMSTGYRGVLGMLKELDIPAAYKGLDWGEVAQRVQNGQVVILNAPTTGGKTGHYFVVEGFDPTTGEFDFGNSLGSLRVGSAGTRMTPEQLNALGAQTTLNMNPDGMIVLEGAPGQVPAGPTASGLPITTTTVTPGSGTRSTGQPVIRGNVGNRPITLWDIALGDWKGPATRAPAPTIQSTGAKPPTTPATSPIWEQRAAEARARPSQDESAQHDQLIAQQNSAKQYADWAAQYMDQAKGISKANIGYAQSGVDDWTEAMKNGKTPIAAEDGSMNVPLPEPDLDATYSPSALVEYPMPEKPPATPLLDELTKAYNDKKTHEWQAAGSDPDKKPERAYTPQEVYQEAVDARQHYMDAEQQFATDYYNASEADKVRIKEDAKKQQDIFESQQRAAHYSPPNEYQRFLEENQAAPGDASVSTNVPQGPTVIPEVPKPTDTRVFSRPDEIAQLQTFDPNIASDEEWAAAGIAPPKSYDDIDAANSGSVAPLPGMGTEKVEAVGSPEWNKRQVFLQNREEQYRQKGYVTQAEKDQLGADLSTNAALGTERYNATQQAIRQSNPNTYQDLGQAARYESVFVSGWKDMSAGTGAGIAALGAVLNKPSLETWGAQVWQRNAQKALQAEVDPRTLSTSEQVIGAAPSVVASMVIGGITSLGLAAAGVAGGDAALIAGGVSALSTVLQEGGGAYQSALEAGATREQATSAFLIQGSINAGIEVTPWGKALSKLPGGDVVLKKIGAIIAAKAGPKLATQITKTTAGNALVAKGAHITGEAIQNFIAEGGQEALQEVVGIATESLYEDRDFQETMVELFNKRGQIIQAGKVGGFLGAGTETAHAILSELGPVGQAIANGMGAERSGTVPGSGPGPTTANINATYAAENQPAQAVGGQRIQLNGPQAIQSESITPDQAAGAAPSQPVINAGPVSDTISPDAPDIVGYRDNLLKTNRKVNEKNLSTKSKSFDDVLDSLETPPDEPARTAAGNPVTPAERITRAAQNLAVAQNYFGGTLNADQRAAILDHYGVTDQNQRVNAAMAGLQIQSDGASTNQVLATIQRAYSAEGANPDAMVFNREFQRGHNRVAQAPQIQGPLPTPPPIQPNGPQTNTFKPPVAVDNSAAPQAAPGNIPLAGQGPPASAVSSADASQPITHVDSHRVDDKFVSKEAGVGGSRSLDGNMTISPRPTNGSFLGNIRDAFQAENDPDGFAAVRSALANRTNKKSAPTIADVMDAIEKTATPEMADRINQRLGVSGYRMRGIPAPQTASQPPVVSARPETTPAPPTAPETAPVAAQVPSATPVSDLPPGQRRVYVPVRAQDFDQAFDQANRLGTISSNGETMPVYDSPSARTELGAELQTLVPAIVQESDVTTHPDGSMTLATPDRSHTPIAFGTPARPRGMSDEATRHRVRLTSNEGRSAAVGSASIDRVDAPTVPGTKTKLAFQKGEVSSKKRAEISKHPAIVAITKGLVKTSKQLVSQMQNAGLGVANGTRFTGVVWAPGIMGVSTGPGENSQFNINPFSIYRQAALWAYNQGMSINSDEFRRQYAKFVVATQVHEISHSVPDDGVDASGHGGGHSRAMIDAMKSDAIDIDAMAAEYYEALTPEHIAAIGQMTEDLYQSVGTPASEEVESQVPEAAPAEAAQAPVDTPVEIAPDESGLVLPERPIAPDIKPTGNPGNVKLVDANQGLGMRSEGRGFFWYGNIMQALMSIVHDGDVAADKNINKRDLQDMSARSERANNAQTEFKEAVARARRASGKASGTLLNVFQALSTFEGKYPGIVNRVAQRARIGGYSYTDEVGQRQEVVFPHAQTQGENNGSNSPRLSVSAPSTSDRSDATRRLNGVGGLGERSDGRTDSESRGTVQSGTSEQSEPANVSGTDRTDARHGDIPPSSGSGGNRQAQPAPYESRPSNYIPGSFVERDLAGNVIKHPEARAVTPKPTYSNGTTRQSVFWSDSQKKWIPYDSHTEHVFMQQLEKAMDLPVGNPKRVEEWRNGTDLVGNDIGIPFVLDEENRYASYNPDFFVHYGDGTNAIIETKSDTAIDLEEGQITPEGKFNQSWRVARKAITMISSLRGFTQFGPVRYQLLGSADKSLTGRNPSAMSQARLRTYEQLSALSSIPFEERFNQISDPEERTAAIHAEIRKQAIAIIQENRAPITGRTRSAASTVFVANPNPKMLPSVGMKELGNFVPNARAIMTKAAEKFGVRVRNIGISAANENLTAPTGIVLDTVGDAAATELMAAELAKESGVAEDPGTFIFREDFRGSDRLASFDVPLADRELEDALMGLSDGERPTLHVVPNEDGTLNITAASRTPNGTRLDPESFGREVDHIKNIIRDHLADQNAVGNEVNQRGVITHFSEPVDTEGNTRPEGGVDNAIARLNEELGQTPLGRAFTNTGTLRNPADYVGRPISSLSRSANARANQETIRQQVENISPNTQEDNLESLSEAREPLNIPDFAGARFQMNAPPLPVAQQNQVPGFDATKFSRDLRGKLKATAQTIHQNGTVPANIITAAQQALNLSPSEYNASYASTLTPIEQASVLTHLTATQNAITTTAQRFTQPNAVAPTRDEFRDFITQGMNYRALHAQLTGRKGAITQASKELTKTKQQAGESADNYAARLFAYSNTHAGKASQFGKNLIASFQHGNIMGATSYQMDKAWEQLLNPRTKIGDWMMGIMYSSLLALRTATNALVFNTAEVAWRGLMDGLTTHGDATIKAWDQGAGPFEGLMIGGVNGTKILGSELAGFGYGFIRGTLALTQTIIHGVSHQQYATEDVPPVRLTNNYIPGTNIRNIPLNALGYTMDIFWNRFFQGVDAFAKTWAYSMQMGREAALESARRNNGRVDWKDAHDLFNKPSQEMMDKSQRVALETAMQGKTGKGGEILANVQNYPIIGRQLFPFLRTLYHTAQRGLERTPWGMVMLAQRLHSTWDDGGLGNNRYIRNQETKELNNVRPFQEVLRDSVVGSALYYAAYLAVEKGIMVLTGQPPDDEKKREQWQREHKISYGIQFPGHFGDAMFSYTNMGPVAPGLAAIAEYHDASERYAEAKNEDEQFNVVSNGVGNYVNSLIDLTFLQTASQLAAAVSADPNDQGKFFASQFGRLAENLISSRIPFGATLQSIGQSQDDYNRYPISMSPAQRVKEIIASKMPMEMPPYLDRYIPSRSMLHPQSDVWGFPVTNPYKGPMVASPVRTTFPVHDPVDEEIKRLYANGVDVRPTRAAKTFEGHQFTDEEYYEWQRRVGQNSYWIVNQMKETDSYRNAPNNGTGSKEEMIKASYQAARETAWDSMAIIDPGAEPNREPEFYGIKEEAAKRGIPWWQYEKDVKNSIGKWNDWQDALKNGRKPPTLSPEEIQQGATYSSPGMRNKMLTLEKKAGINTVKKSVSDLSGIPFNAAP